MQKFYKIKDDLTSDFLDCTLYKNDNHENKFIYIN